MTDEQYVARRKKNGVPKRDAYWSSNPANPKYWKGYTRRYFCDDAENLTFPKGHTTYFLEEHLPHIKHPKRVGTTPYLQVETYHPTLGLNR